MQKVCAVIKDKKRLVLVKFNKAKKKVEELNIALLAHDKKKELMVQFCIAYKPILAKHSLCATGTTGKLVKEATGLEITKFLSGSQGGDQQISSRIAYNEIDLVLCFRDPLTARGHEPDAMALLRLVMFIIFLLQLMLQLLRFWFKAFREVIWIGVI
jgi:methylglyoxal synthase